MKTPRPTGATALRKSNHARLVHAIWDGDKAAFLDCLATAPELDFRDPSGRTVLYEAVIESRIDLIEPIIRAGGDVHARDSYGMSPLHYAADKGLIEAAEILLSHGAEIGAVDNYGNTPLFKTVFRCPKNEKMIALLLQNGANPDAANIAGVSPRSLAKTLGLSLFV